MSIVSIKPQSQFLSLIAIIALLGLVRFNSELVADEVIMDDRANTSVSVGDFTLTGCPANVTHSLGLFGKNNSGEVSAGQLWKFFHDQGVSSLDRLTLCLDIEELDSEVAFDLRSIQLQIEDPMVRGNLLTNVSLGNNSILVPGTNTSSYKPEAKLQILLNYDFMQRFSADSKEMIKLDFTSSGEMASMASISIEGSGNVFSRFNQLLLIGFAVFWIVVFYVLNRATKPLAEVEPSPNLCLARDAKTEPSHHGSTFNGASTNGTAKVSKGIYSA